MFSGLVEAISELLAPTRGWQIPAPTSVLLLKQSSSRTVYLTQVEEENTQDGTPRT
jgi:hypothetical protein